MLWTESVQSAVVWMLAALKSPCPPSLVTRLVKLVGDREFVGGPRRSHSDHGMAEGLPLSLLPFCITAVKLGGLCIFYMPLIKSNGLSKAEASTTGRSEIVSRSKTSFLYKLIISGISYSYRNVSKVFIFALSSTSIK